MPCRMTRITPDLLCQNLLALMNDADPEIPLLQLAKLEYAKGNHSSLSAVSVSLGN
jgi:hypothetical protein